MVYADDKNPTDEKSLDVLLRYKRKPSHPMRPSLGELWTGKLLHITRVPGIEGLIKQDTAQGRENRSAALDISRYKKVLLEFFQGRYC